MKLYLIFLNVWIAAVYYMIYCEPRSYNSALAGFWGIMAIFWIYDLKVNYTPFDRTHKHTALAVLLCTFYFSFRPWYTGVSQGRIREKRMSVHSWEITWRPWADI